VDDELNGRLAALATDVGASVHLAPAGRVRARGDRHRTHVVAAAAAAVVALAGGMAAVQVVGGGDADPAVTPTGWYTDIPERFRLSHEGEAGWQRSDDASVSSAFLPCGADGPISADPTLVGRTDARTVTGPGRPIEGSPPARLTEQLLAFRDDHAASAALWALAQSVNRCGWSTAHADGGPGYDTDVLFTSRVVSDSVLEEASVLHRGNALYLVFTESGGVGYGGYFLGQVDVRQELCEVMQLCYP